jgi:hypothetical protein
MDESAHTNEWTVQIDPLALRYPRKSLFRLILALASHEYWIALYANLATNTDRYADCYVAIDNRF